MKLRNSLRDRSQVLSSRLEGIEAKARQLIEYSQGGSHLTFTPHGVSHISAVEENFDWLLSDRDVENMNPVEIFCLLSATFFHDAMMIPPKLGAEAQAREQHALAAIATLQKQRDLIGLSIHEADAIAEIIKGHAVGSLIELRQNIALGSTLIDIHKLGACLSLSDICHADASRAPEIVFRYLELDEESAYHWRRHLQISGVTRKDDAILMSAVYFSDEGKTAVEEYRAEVEKQLKLVSPYFHSVLTPITKVELQAKQLASNLDVSMRFQANTPAILDILIEGVYERPDVFLRELVQNSIDACHIRSARAIKRAESFAPRIIVTLLKKSEKTVAIRIDDNGIGMDVRDVQDTVLWIGNTISKRNDVKKLLSETTDKQLIATFGIGLLSCFKAASIITIRSRKEARDPIELSMSSITQEIKPTLADDQGVGSTFLVTLKEDLQDTDFVHSAYHFFRMVRQSSLELMILDHSDKSLSLTRAEILTMAISEASVLEVVGLDEMDESVCDQELHGDNYTAWLWLPSSKSDVFATDDGKISILSEGVFISRDEAKDWLPAHLSSCEGVINFSAKAVDLPVSRDRVVVNSKLRAVIADLGVRSLGLIDQLVTKSASANRPLGDNAALAISFMCDEAETDEWRTRILKRCDQFHARFYQRDRGVTLSYIRQQNPPVVYIEYLQGRTVTEVGKLDGKMLYHKEDDFSQLQASILRQSGSFVLSTSRNDVGDIHILEANLIKKYFAHHNIPTVDVTVVNVVAGSLRSKPLPKNVRQELSTSVKFVEVAGLPSKRAWKVGQETWLNLANIQIEQLYNMLQEDTTDIERIRLARVLVSICSLNFETAFGSLLEQVLR